LGRYKNSGAATVKLTGTVNGVARAYSFPVTFAAEETGHTYLPRLWAMRRIAHLTDVAKDNGDNKEVVDEIIALSKKYGIISAYTSFLVTDPNEKNAHGTPIATMPSPMMGGGAFFRGRANDDFERQAGAGAGSAMNARKLAPSSAQRFNERKARAEESRDWPIATSGIRVGAFGSSDSRIQDVVAQLKASNVSGQAAVRSDKQLDALKNSVAIVPDKDTGIKVVEAKTFYLRDGEWIDTAYNEKASMPVSAITFGSKEYFDLLKIPGLSKFLSVGKQVIFVFNHRAYKIVNKQAS